MTKSEKGVMNRITKIFRSAKNFIDELSIRWKIVLTTVIFTVSLTIATLVLVFRGYSADRLAYIFENHSAQVQISSSRTREILVQTTAGEVGTAVEKAPEFIKRPPEDDEIFIEESPQKKRVLQIFWRDNQGDIRTTEVKPRIFSAGLGQMVTTNMMIVTQKGTLLYSNNENQFPEEQQIQLFAFAMKSNMSNGNTVVEYKGKPFAVGFAEIPNTNLVAVTATSLASITAPLQRAIAIWAIIAAQFIALGAAFQWFFAGRITRPIEAITQLFAQISRGNFRMKMTPPPGEMRAVVEGAMTMQRAIAIRERRLSLEAQGLKDILDLRGATELARNTVSLSAEIVARFARTAPLHSHCMPMFFDLVKNECWVQSESNSGKATWEKIDKTVESIVKLATDGGYLNGGHITSGHPALLPFYEKTDAPVLVVPFIQQQCIAILIMPMDPMGVFPELLELVSVTVTTIESMLNQIQAADSATKQAMVDRELSLAREIQERSISLSQLTQKSVSFDSLFQPANMVGGDWMAVFEHPQKSIVNFYVGDVTGHGIDAAFHTSLIAGAIQLMETQLEHSDLGGKTFDGHTHLAELTPHLNQVLVKSGAGKSMTMFLGVLEVLTGKLHFALLGHPAPLLIRNKGTAHTTLAKAPGPSLGTDGFNSAPPIHAVELAPGDTVVAYTDGLTENIILEDGKVLSRKLLLKQTASILKADHSDESVQTGENENKVTTGVTALYNWSLEAGMRYEKNDDVAILAVTWNGASNQSGATQL